MGNVLPGSVDTNAFSAESWRDAHSDLLCAVTIHEDMDVAEARELRDWLSGFLNDDDYNVATSIAHDLGMAQAENATLRTRLAEVEGERDRLRSVIEGASVFTDRHGFYDESDRLRAALTPAPSDETEEVKGG